MAKWLDKYEQGGMVLKKKTKDNYGKRENPNDVQAFVGPDFVGLGYDTTGRNYSPAWGGQFQDGGNLPEVTVYGHRNRTAKAYFDRWRKEAEDWQDRESPVNSPMSSYLAGEQMYSKYKGHDIKMLDKQDRPMLSVTPFGDTLQIHNPESDYRGDSLISELAHKVQLNKKGNLGFIKSHIGNDYLNTLKNMSLSDIFNADSWKSAYDKNYYAPGTQEYEAHSIIEPKLREEFKVLADKEYDKLTANKKKAMGGGIPGTVGFTYARTQDPAPSNGKLTLPEAIVYGHKDPSTKAYFNKVRAIAENYQDKNFWLSPLAGYHTLEQMHSKYGAPKINTIGEDDRAHYEPFTDVMSIPNPTKFNGGNETMDIFLEELAHKVQRNKKGIIGISTKQLTKDYLNTLKNIDSSDIFTKQGWIDAYEKNYTTPGTLENEAHSVISPKLKEEYRDIRSKNFDRLYGDMAMGGALPGAVGFSYARVAGSAPANGKYTKKTKASAQDGKVLSPDADDRSILGFRTSDPAFQNVKSNAFVPFDPNNFEGIRQNIAGYMNSPLYMDRLSKSIPDAENAKDTQQRRLNNLLSIKLNPKTVNEGTNYNRNQNRINLDATDFIDNAAISHEIAHGIVPNLTTNYGKQNMFAKAANVVGDLFQPFEQFSNSELEKINRPLSGKITAPNFDYMMARKEEHYKPQGSKASAKTAANETYGDLTGMRQLLLDNGITTEFGQDLTPEIFKKATENKRVMNSPAFKRMKLKFKDEDIIKMNNEVAYNNANNRSFDQAQNGKEMSFYQQGLDFTPKTISKNGSIIKDDMGQWAHPGEITEIGSNDITMEGVDYPVLGISDTGDTKLMQPGEDYKFDGEKVTEFPVMEKGGWLDKFDNKAQDGKYVSMKNNKNWFDSHANWSNTGNKQYDDLVRKSVLSGRFGVDPNTGDLIKLKESEWTDVSDIEKTLAKDKRNWTKKEKDEAGDLFNSMTPEGQEFREAVVAGDMKHMFMNPLFYAPAALAAAPFVAGAASAAAPILGAAMNAPIAGVAGLTGSNIMNAAFAYQAAKNLPNVATTVKTAVKQPTLSNIGSAALETGITALNALPFLSTASKGVKPVINEIGNAYNTVATGESALPIAWKSPAKGLSQEASDAMFKGLANANKLSDADRALLLEYQYDSKPFTGRWGTVDQSKKDALNNAINNNELTINNNAILTRRFNPENQSLGAEFVGNKLNLGDRPSSFSAGVGLPSYQSGAVDRLVVPNRYAKQMGNEFLANEYGIPSDKTFDLLKGKSKDWAASIGVNPTDMVNAEREVIGTGLDFKRIGRVKNDIGGYDHIVRPRTINKSTGTQSVTRGPINWWESPTFKKNNPNYDPTKPPLNPFPKYTAENVPEELNPYLSMEDDLPDDYIELPDYNMKLKKGGWLNKYK